MPNKPFIKTAPLYTDSQLLLQWKEGNELAFEALYKKHVREVLSMALKKVADKDLAEDLVHDAFISLYKQKETLSVEVSIPAYLYVTLKNKIYNHYRKNVTHQLYAAYIQYAATELENTTQNTIETQELERLLNNEIERLPQQCKLVFKLSRKNYLSNKEIALQLNISENTVEQHMRRALRQLKGSFVEYLHLILAIVLIKYR
jgi:RNA polymerase sigma-70 factor (family 1)